MKKKKRKVNAAKLIIVLMFLLMTSMGVGIFIKSSYFNLQYIDVIGNDNLNKNEIIETLGINSNRNIFSYNIILLKNKLLKNPYIEDASIKINVPNKLSINVKEKEVWGPISNGTDYCYIDKKGNMIEKVETIDTNKKSEILVKIDCTINDNKIAYKNKCDKKYMIELLDSIEKNNIQNQLASIAISDDKINITGEKGMDILLLKDKKISYNISRLNKILIDLNNENIAYGSIDLTYDKYAIYKLKG